MISFSDREISMLLQQDLNLFLFYQSQSSQRWHFNATLARFKRKKTQTRKKKKSYISMLLQHDLNYIVERRQTVLTYIYFNATLARFKQIVIIAFRQMPLMYFNATLARFKLICSILVCMKFSYYFNATLARFKLSKINQSFPSISSIISMLLQHDLNRR